MCLGMSPTARVKPTDRGLVLGTWLFYLMMGILIITILALYFQLSSGFYSLILCMIGLCAVDKCPCNCNNLGQRFIGDDNAVPQDIGPIYNIEQLLCVIFFSGYLWVITLVSFILFLAELKASISEVAIGVTIYFGGLILYGVSLYISKQLYDELRLNYSPIQLLGQQNPFLGGPAPQPNQTQQQQQQQQSYQNFFPQYQQSNNVNATGNIRPNTNNNQNTSFKPFQGKGYSLAD